ncbi:MAG: endonuclease/exonuclease/phosphatase family protein [Eubacteriales bacterium]|nr:endonuclease/exonuclease/phosphatase family protein [Eubacteriales bacterium]
MIKVLLKGILGILVLAVLITVGYLAYVLLTYRRIPDKQELKVENRTDRMAETGKEYTAVTLNVGFGAYLADFTFFMDGGKESRARSKESVLESINHSGGTTLSFGPDLTLFQEVDTDSTRSWHVDEAALLRGLYDDTDSYDSVFAQNYHSAYLMVPVTKPHGASNSGLLTESRMQISSALRRRLPIAKGLKKFLDLDRCYSVSRIPVKDGGELVVYNVHLSAYGTDAAGGTAQLRMLAEDMENEYSKGNYVVCGGDFNHDFTGSSKEYFNPGTDKTYSWCQPFPGDVLPEGFRRCMDYAGKMTATSRLTDIPYSEDSFTVILDGFIVSDNVECSYVENIDAGYQYTDHNPVVMRFFLKPGK